VKALKETEGFCHRIKREQEEWRKRRGISEPSRKKSKKYRMTKKEAIIKSSTEAGPQNLNLAILENNGKSPSINLSR